MMNSGSETYPGYKQDVKDFALLLYAYMKEYCIGREISTRELVSEAVEPTSALGSNGEVATDDELWDVHNALYDIVERGRKYVMDFDRFVDASVGFPYDIPFIFRLRSAKHKF